MLVDCPVDVETGELLPVVTIVTDNGGPFRSFRFEAFIAGRPELSHVRTRVKSPGQNGSRERGFGTLKYERLYIDEIDDAHMLAKRAEDYRIEYNEIRPHEAMAWNRPFEVHLGLADPTIPTFQIDRIPAHYLTRDRRRNRLDWLRLGDLEVRASLTLSYNHLKPPEQRLFRLLGALHAPDFPAWTANALLDDNTTAPQHLLDTLADAHLIEITPANGQARYHLHPLVHLLATELTDRHDTPTERHTALQRLTEGLLTTADAAARAMKQRFVLDELPNGCWMPPEITKLARAQPVAWMSGEGKTIQAIVEHAAPAGLVAHAWLLFQRLAYELLRRNDLDTQDRLITYLLPIVCATADVRGEATLLRFRCDVLAYRDRYSEIPDIARRVVASRHGCHDTPGEVEARRLVGAALINQGQWNDGRSELRIALNLGRQIGDHLGISKVLYALASRPTVEPAARKRAYAEALNEARLGDASTGEILRDFGLLLANDGHPDRGADLLKLALVEFEEVGDAWRAATAEIALARIWIDLGALEQAERLLTKGRQTILAHSDGFGLGAALFVESQLPGRGHAVFRLS